MSKNSKILYLDGEIVPFEVERNSRFYPCRGWVHSGLNPSRDWVHSGLSPFRVQSLWGWVPSGLSPFGIKSIRGSGLSPFMVGSIRGWVNLGLGPFRVGSILVLRQLFTAHQMVVCMFDTRLMGLLFWRRDLSPFLVLTLMEVDLKLVVNCDTVTYVTGKGTSVGQGLEKSANIF
jgi:hypothetical protein